MSFENFNFLAATLIPYFIFVLFMHGGLVALIILSYSPSVPIASSYGALILGGFFISLFINLTFFIGLSLSGLSIWIIKELLLVLDICLLVWVIVRREIIIDSLRHLHIKQAGIGLLILITIMTIIMLRNGGLIDLLADSWWHMSLASRILADESIFLLRHHLIGFPLEKFTFSYPFLWHTTLAFISHVSSVELPVIWHTIAIVIVALSLIGFNLFCFALTRDQWVSLLATILFCLLYGGLNSYFRVMSWPGNVSYLGLYYFWFLYFQFQYSIIHGLTIKQLFTQSKPYWFIFLLVSVVVAATHGVALLLFFISIALYFYGTVILSILHPELLKQSKILSQVVVILPLIAICTVFGLLLFPNHLLSAINRFNHVAIISYMFFLLIPVAIALVLQKYDDKISSNLRIVMFFGWAVPFVFYSLDWQHFTNLFTISETISNQHIPKNMAQGALKLILPNWSHQLKGGLLFSGILSVPIALIILWIKKDIGSLFLCANAMLVSLALSSPVLYWIVTAGISNTSSYRIHLLILHPIIYATALMTLVNILKNRD